MNAAHPANPGSSPSRIRYPIVLLCLVFSGQLSCGSMWIASDSVGRVGQSVTEPSLDQPNIVYILVDNWGWADVSVQGGKIPTPRIDELAAAGIRLTNFNVENQCTPTRSAIHTGRLPIRSGTQRVSGPGDADGLAVWEYTLAELLSDEGYATALFGKWHLGSQPGRMPNDQGYDSWWGINEGSNAAGYTATPQFDPAVAAIPHVWVGEKGAVSRPIRKYDIAARERFDRESVDRAAEFIRARAKSDRPFFAFVGFTHLHPPFVVHPDFNGRSGKGIYADSQLEIDFNVGRLLDAIQQVGVAENTLVILTGDNGPGSFPVGEGPDWFVEGSAGPWRGGLSTGYEGGLRTPAIAKWPGHIPAARVSDEIFSALDWLPTLAHLIGGSTRIPTDRPIDGVDQSEFLLGRQLHSNRESTVTFVGEEIFAVKWRNMKMHFFTAEHTHSPIQSHTFPKIFDLEVDPGELRELWEAEGFVHAWVTTPISKIIADLKSSMQSYPNIQPGHEFPGYE
ncbi:MAG: arylsulfatase [Myxococcales bacterium]